MLPNCGAGEDSWESLGQQTDKLVNPKGNQPQIFIERTDVEAEAPILWPPDIKSRLIGKDSVAGKDWGQEENGATESEMVGWPHRLNGHESEQVLGDGEEQGSLACYSEWSRKESDTTERLNEYMVDAQETDIFEPSFCCINSEIQSHIFITF